MTCKYYPKSKYLGENLHKRQSIYEDKKCKSKIVEIGYNMKLFYTLIYYTVGREHEVSVNLYSCIRENG